MVIKFSAISSAALLLYKKSRKQTDSRMRRLESGFALAVMVLFLPSAGIAQQTSKVLTDYDLLKYQATPFVAREVMHKTIVLGTHNGITVIAEHPCGDLCPDYTRRIIRYDIKNSKCRARKGVLANRTINKGIVIMPVQVCVPKVLEKDSSENHNHGFR